MQTVLVVSAVVNFLATIVLAGALESFSESKWGKYIGASMGLCVVLWLISFVLMLVYFPGYSEVPDPRF
jgi:xanthine/uracil/vitamin C permease (AzgA family)